MRSTWLSRMLAALAAAALAGSAAAQTQTPTPPGLSATSWKLLSAGSDAGTFFSPGHLGRGRGWFTLVFTKPRSYGGVATGVHYIQSLEIADCAAGTLTNAVLAFYDEDGRPLRALPVPDAKPNAVQPGTPGAAQLNLLCGRPAKLYADHTFTTPGTELLGVFTAMLDIQANDARASAPQAAAPSARPTQPAPASGSGGRAPGLGPAAWKVLALNARGASFFTEARIRRFGDRATGWFTDIYPEPLTLASNPGVSINQTQWEADCTNGALRLVYGAFYRADGSPIAQRSLDTSTPEQQRPGTLGALRLDALCGRPVQLYTNQILQTDVLGLRNAYRAQLASNGAGAPPAQASGAGPAPASGSGVRAPGLAAAAWKVLYLNPVLAGFYTPATIRRSGGRASGWITEIFAKPQQGDGQIRDVSIRQSLQEADCAAGTLRSIYAAFYRADGGLIAASPTGSLPPQKPQTGSIGALNMDALCGRPIQLYSDQPLEMSVLDLKNVYATKLALDRVGGTQGQGSATPAARPPSASPASAAAAQMPAPGMKVATWKFLDGYDDRGVAFIPAQVRRVPGGGQGWMMEVYRKPVNMPNIQLRNVGIDQILYSADCAQNTLTNAARVFYSPTGAQLASLGGFGTVRPPPGSPAADFLNILCGRPQALWEDDPHTVGALELRQLYIVTLQIQDAVDGK